MNFSPFGGHFPTSIPTIHQFAAKFSSHDNASNALCQETNSSRYTANGVPSFTQHHPPAQQHMISASKFQGGNYINQSVYGHQNNVRVEKRQSYEHQELTPELCAVMLQQNQVQQQQQHQTHEKQQNNDKIKQEAPQEDRRNHHQQQHQQQQNQPQQQQPQNQVQSPQQNQATQNQIIGTSSSMPTSWQSLATPGSTVADYLSHLPASTLPLSLHHFLKYSAETIKKESGQQQLNLQSNDNLSLLHTNLTTNAVNTNGLTASTINTAVLTSNTNVLGSNAITTLNSLSTINTSQLQGTLTTTKKKKKKKPEKEKKPRPKPGEIRLTTALDGSTLYCCPECHMAYPEKELLEQHLVGHTLERRFVCDICGAGLKRKDHLTRHKQSHNPERPYVCTVCLKAFKRKEQLTLHFVIHSGEKRHICTECGKGFYRKDHLRKHTRSHIARRVKAELSQQGSSNTASLQIQVAAPTAIITSNSNGSQERETNSSTPHQLVLD